ncbi:hypothetical protein AAVH_17806 [Aphelenchoides avenae]|nr:hypothetical protein AAVH_17806 [Aphelenchus avenae]
MSNQQQQEDALQGHNEYRGGNEEKPFYRAGDVDPVAAGVKMDEVGRYHDTGRIPELRNHRGQYGEPDDVAPDNNVLT